MNLEQGTKLRSQKVIDSPLEDNTSTQSVMTEQNMVDSDSNDDSDLSSQLTEIKENYERKVSDLQSEFGQLKDLMKAIISKTNDDSPTSSSQGTSKQPRGRFDMVTGVTETHSIRPATTFTSNVRQFHDDDGDATPRSYEERLLNAIETIPQRIKSSTTNTKLLQTLVPSFSGRKDKFVEIEHLLLNHLSPLADKITQEDRLHSFQSLLIDEE